MSDSNQTNQPPRPPAADLSSVDNDLEARRQRLIADLQRLAAGWTPDDATLSNAPFIDQWYADFYPGSRNICLVGAVTGHPRLGDQVVTTSPVIAIDPQYRWVRTHGRFYRLGNRAQFRVIDTDYSGLRTIYI